MDAFITIWGGSDNGTWRRFFGVGERDYMRLRNDPDRLGLLPVWPDSVSAADPTGISLIHPANKALATFRMWRDDVDQYCVRDPACLGALQTPAGRKDGILFLLDDLGPNLEIQPEHTPSVYYRRLDEKYLTSRSGPSPGGSAMTSHLYKECDKRDSPTPRTVRVVHQPEPRGEWAGWHNPVIVRSECNGKLPAPSVAGLMKTLIDGGQPLLVVPLHDPSELCRSLFLEQLERSSIRQKHERSAMELLFSGPDAKVSPGSPAWEPMLSLDQLGGTFLLREHGSGRFSIAWSPGLPLAPNAEWIARLMIERLGATWSDEAVPGRLIPSAEPVYPVRSFQPTIRLLLPGPVQRSAELLSPWAERTSARSQAVIDIISRLLSDERLLDSPVNRAHLGCSKWQILTDGAALCWLDEAAFLDRLASFCIVPRSRVLIQVPSSDRWIDLLESVEGGAAELLVRLVESVGRPSEAARVSDPIKIRPGAGWWNLWFNELFLAPAQVRVTPPQAQRFILGITELGDLLGEQPMIDENSMRF